MIVSYGHAHLWLAYRLASYALHPSAWAAFALVFAFYLAVGRMWRVAFSLGGLDRGPANRRAWYRRVYLRSPHWMRTRGRAIRRAGGCCEVCGSDGPLDVHHRSYAHLWRERDADLEVLCRSCHRAREGR